MRTIQGMIAELETVERHARRAQLALQFSPPHWHDAQRELSCILAAVPDLGVIHVQLLKKTRLPPTKPPT